MSDPIVVVVTDEPSSSSDAVEAVEATVDALTEVVEEHDEVIESLIDHVVDAIVETAEETDHEDNVALIVGALVTGLNALTGRVDAIESRLTVEEELTEAIVDDVVEDETETIQPDVAPSTKRSRFSAFWFGDK